MNPERLVFIDETGATTNMTRRHGRAKRGERLVMAVPHDHWKTTTFVAGLRHDRIDAPCVIDGPMNRELFLAYVEQFLAPTLSAGDTIGLLLNAFDPAECQNHLRNSGYVQPTRDVL